jgi:hypothetical protein
MQGNSCLIISKRSQYDRVNTGRHVSTGAFGVTRKKGAGQADAGQSRHADRVRNERVPSRVANAIY